MLIIMTSWQVTFSGTCVENHSGLHVWNPGHSGTHRVHIGHGKKFLLTTSATVESIEITDGGKLVIADNNEPIVLRTRNILIENGGEFHIGSETCPFQGNLTIILYGRSDDGYEPHSYFGHKFIGVARGGTLEIHGQKKVSWTFLNKTLHSGGMNEGGYYFERNWGHRGIIAHVIDPQSGEVVHSDRFDTYKSKEESERLAQYVIEVEDGMILSLAMNDEGSRSLRAMARKALTQLGSKHVMRLGYRHPWSFIVVKGDPSSAVEDHAIYQDGRNAVAKIFKVFQADSGEPFTVSSTSEWIQDTEWTDWFSRDDERGSGDWEKLSDLRVANPGKICRNPIEIEASTHEGVLANLTGEIFYKYDRNYGFVCRNHDQTDGICHNYKVRFLCTKDERPKVTITIDTNVNSTILELEDDVRTWQAGDTIVVASTDFSMYQAEEFQLLPCKSCLKNQIRAAGKAKYLHVGEVLDGVDMRAEVGMLTRNILIMGEMEDHCYGNNACEFFDFDTFGGHLKVGIGFKAVHIEGVELKHMGQQTMGHYPIHFHMAGDVDEKGGYSNPPTYVKQAAVHHSFSRCLTIHGSNGLQVKDVVGYDTLGHCFFTEDGPEERNTFDHCLGLLIKAGTLLPSDRDSKMCKLITDGAYPGYIARTRQDCSAVSTFWMANPNNNLMNCAAAGSVEAGFWFIFHHVPTGPSQGMYSPGHSEHMPLGKFYNNRAHSNYRAGMIIDNGVKTTEASAKDKRPFLSIIGARYGPHKDADPYKPREPAIIQHFIAYKNQEHGAWLRGGDVWLDSCQFSDNGIGLTLASGGTFPDDDGSKQEIKNSLFVGESENRGTESIDNEVWGPGGRDHSGRTLPRGINFPIRGMQIYDGPINVQNCTFRKYVALDGRHTSAIGFRLNNSWQSCPKNNMTEITFDSVPINSRVFFGEPGPWFSAMDMDGDKTTIFHDVDGSVCEYPGAYIVKDDNWLLRNPGCIDVPDWRAAICNAHYAQLYIQARNPADLVMKIIKNEYPDHPQYLEGALGKKNHYQQYQPVITLQKGYTIHWDGTPPEELTVWLINFNKHDWIQLGLCYPKGTTFSILSDIHNRVTKQTYKTGIFLRTFQVDKLESTHPGRGYYYWDEDTGLLFLKVKAQNEREKDAFCSEKGCERIKIKAVIPPGAGLGDCTGQAYPLYAEVPAVEVPMPVKLPRGKLSTNEYFTEVRLESYKTRFFHIKDEIAYTEINGKTFYQTEDGIQMTVLDGHTGDVIDSTEFKNSVLQGIPAQVENYVTNIKNSSIVLITSKGKFITKGQWTRILETLGADNGVRLKDQLTFVGFKGSFKPIWVKMVTDEEAAKIHLVLPVPVINMMKM